MEFDPGDGNPPVSCSGEEAKKPYDVDAPLDALITPSNTAGPLGVCRYVYLDSSVNEPGGVYTATVTIFWDFEGTGSGLANIDIAEFAATELDFPVPVAEARSVVVNPDS